MEVDLDQLITAVEDSADEPLDRVSSAALLKDQLAQIGDDLLDHFVKAARDAGCSWTEVGDALGVTRQAAQQRHGGLLDRLLTGLNDGGRVKRFTGKARTAVMEARAAARDRNNGSIGTEHVLLGLFAADDGNIAMVALGRLGVDRATVERLVDERVERGESPVRGHLRFTRPAKKALELAVREALALGHNYIGTEHIVLALRRTEEGGAGQILGEQGVSYDDLRTTVLELLQSTTRT